MMARVPTHARFPGPASRVPVTWLTIKCTARASQPAAGEHGLGGAKIQHLTVTVGIFTEPSKRALKRVNMEGDLLSSGNA